MKKKRRRSKRGRTEKKVETKSNRNTKQQEIEKLKKKGEKLAT